MRWRLNNTILIFLGAGVGGVLRYWVSNAIYLIFGRQFPAGTLVVNTTGCFLMGLLFVLILERMNGTGQQLRPLLLIGLLGGYTTFSSFSIETLNLFESGAWITAFVNILASLVLCIALTWFGMICGRQL